MKEDRLIVKNNNGEIMEYCNPYFNTDYFLSGMDISEIISIPDNCEILFLTSNKLTSLPELTKKIIKFSCEDNNIKQLPNLRECKKLVNVWCDICCFEDYMLEMKNTQFEFYC